MVLFIAKNGEYESDRMIKLCFIKYLRLLKTTNIENGSFQKAVIFEKNIDFDEYYLLENLRINRTAKPYLELNGKRLNVHFSLSHSNEIIIAGFSDCEIGVDVEYHKPRAYEKIAEREFSYDEKPSSLEEFYDTWTRKEAIIKCRGLTFGAAAKTYGRELGVKNLNLFENYSVAVYPSDNLVISLLT